MTPVAPLDEARGRRIAESSPGAGHGPWLRPLALTLAVAASILGANPCRSAETVVSIEVDTNDASQYQVRQMLLDRGMRATFFIPSSRIGRSGSMSLAQLRDLQNDGNEI